MNSLKINKTQKTPEINFDLNSGVFLVSGISVPENAIEFYTEIIDWLKKYVEKPKTETSLIFKLAYINTSSLQALYDSLFLLDEINNIKSNISIQWFFLTGDEDMREVGEDLQDALSFEFTFIEIEDI